MTKNYLIVLVLCSSICFCWWRCSWCLSRHLLFISVPVVCSLFVVLVHELILCVWRCSLFSPLCSVSSVLSFVLWLCFLNLLFFVLDRVLCSCCSLFLFFVCIIMFIVCALFFVFDLDAETSYCLMLVTTQNFAHASHQSITPWCSCLLCLFLVLEVVLCCWCCSLVLFWSFLFCFVSWNCGVGVFAIVPCSCYWCVVLCSCSLFILLCLVCLCSLSRILSLF